MGFLQHLGELRKRLTRALLATIPGVCVGWNYSDKLLDWLARPLVIAWRKLNLGEPVLHFPAPWDAFSANLQVALVAGLLLAAPVIFWQLWAFVSPGLYRRERRLAIPFSLAATVCFVGGALFGYIVVFPPTFETLLGFAGMLPSGDIRIQPTLMLSEYIPFCLQMLLAFGVVFEVPVVVSFLALAGIVNWKQLLWFGRWWVLVAAIVAAILTPPDVASQIMMLGPLVVLYYLSVLLAYFFGPKSGSLARETK